MSEPESDTEGETITIHELLERSAESALELQREDGSFPPGRNYTYDEPETPVRTTAHWLYTLLEAYEITGEKDYRFAANNAVNFLLSKKARPHGYTFHYRKTANKDKCNGVVGQVFPIRSLVRASEVLGRKDAWETATDVFSIHPFNEKLGLWERVEIDGRKLSFDRTLNHQILFAAGCAELARNHTQASKRIRQFLDRIETNMRLHSDGLIKHYVRPHPIETLESVIRQPRHYKMLLNEVVFHYYSRSSERRKKERGYQAVNLVPLVQLKHVFEEHPLWETEMISRAIGYIQQNDRGLMMREDIKHGSTMPGISIAKIYHEFLGTPYDELTEYIEFELEKQLNDSYHFGSGESAAYESAQASALVDFPNLQLTIE